FREVTQHCQAITVECLTDSSKQYSHKTSQRHQSRANGRPKILTKTKLMKSDVKDALHSDWLGVRGVSMKFYMSEQKQMLESNRFTGGTRTDEPQHRGNDKIRAWSIKDTTSASYQAPPMKGILKSCSGSSISEEQRGICQTVCSRNSFDSTRSPKKVQFKSESPLDATESFIRMLHRRAPTNDLTHHDLPHHDLQHDFLPHFDLVHEDQSHSPGNTVKFCLRGGANQILSYDECVRLAGGLTTGHRCCSTDEMVVQFADGAEGGWSMNKNNQGLDSNAEDNDDLSGCQAVQQDKLLSLTNRPVSSSILKFITKHQNLIPANARLNGSADHRMAHMPCVQSAYKDMLSNVPQRQGLKKLPSECAAPGRLAITPGVVAKHCETMCCPVKNDNGGPDAGHLAKGDYIKNGDIEISYVKNFQLEASEVTAAPNDETLLR
ncbi:unnamed protein product, partial [Lymnaea stagnalis]